MVSEVIEVVLSGESFTFEVETTGYLLKDFKKDGSYSSQIIFGREKSRKEL